MATLQMAAPANASSPIADLLAARLYRKRNALFIQKHYNELYPVVSLVEDTVSVS